MSEQLTSIQAQEFLKNWEENSSVELLEEGAEKNEIIQIAKAKGIDLRGNKDLAGIKLIYAFADKANKNKARLPKLALLKALPTMIGKPVDLEHLRNYVVGYYIDYRYVAKEDMVIAYAIIFKSNFQNEWEKMQELFKAKKLTTSYEIYCPKNKRKYLEDGTYELQEQDIAGGAILLKEKPAFEDCKVLEFARAQMTNNKDLVFASKYHCEDLVINGKFECAKCGNCHKETEYVIAEDNTISTTDSANLLVTAEEVKPVEPIKVEPIIVKEEVKPIEPVEVIPEVVKVKCSKCQEEIVYEQEIKTLENLVQCKKCKALIDKDGKMIYPPQEKNFKVSCPSCRLSSWTLLEKSDKSAKIRCSGCKKEYEVEFGDEAVKNLVMQIPFIYEGSASCIQCGTMIYFSRASTEKLASLTCKRCKIAFNYKIDNEISNKNIVNIKELELQKASDVGGNEMEYILEISKFHREVEVENFDEYLKELVLNEAEGLEDSAKLPYEQRQGLSDDKFAVVIRVKNKKTGKMEKIRKYPIHDEAHVRNALARLGQEAPKAELQQLKVKYDDVMKKVLKKAKELKMVDLLTRHEEDIKRLGISMSKMMLEEDAMVELANAEEDIRGLINQVIQTKANVDTLNLANVNLQQKLVTGIKKLAAQVVSTRKQVSLYKANAQKICERKVELAGFATTLTDEDLLNEDKYARAIAEKIAIEVSSQQIEKASETISLQNQSGNDYYEAKRKEINQKAQKYLKGK